MKLRIVISIVLCGFALSSNAGVNDLTFHSRANCIGFNESVTWRLGYAYELRTTSYHDNQYNDNYDHGLVDPPTPPGEGDQYRKTWRSIAYHGREAYYQQEYKVHGWHWIREGGKTRKLGETWAEDCSIYDGWWNY